MIPSVVARQVEQGIKDFLRTTFPPSTPFFEGILERLFEERSHLFKGPYISVGLPFRAGTIGRGYFGSFTMPNVPFVHQEQAFLRLAGEAPQSTLVSTGTGSGKTECFLYPILDYCYRHRGEPGIKAIIIYPMNALANDQSKRIARFIAKTSQLKGNVTAGLFIGQEAADAGQSVMTDGMVITNKDTLRSSPPDILLTNYKMLDYLLIRPVDFPLWKENAAETLKYLVVDEIHTFDGAQGTDLACLIRRLKARLRAPQNHLCCVGTSATLGGEEDDTPLRSYAEEVFGELFDQASVITEERLSAREFLADAGDEVETEIASEDADKLSPDRYGSWDEFVRAQYALWFRDGGMDPGDPHAAVELGARLRRHGFLRSLLRVLDGRLLPMDEIVGELRKIDPVLHDAASGTVGELVESMLALVSVARRVSGDETTFLPFLDIRVQVWMRELRRVVAEVGRRPALRFSDDLKPAELGHHLPLVHCRECGAMGWGAVKRQHEHALSYDLQTFYAAFFGYSPSVHFLFPEAAAKGDEPGFDNFVCGECLHLGVGPIPESCPSCGSSRALVPVLVWNDRHRSGDRFMSTHRCPFCESSESLTVVGSRSASMLSVVIGQLFNTPYYNDPQRKLLTFSDSVQDAAHRAGFFEARTFRFSLRTAIQKAVQEAGGRALLSDLPGRFSAFWRDRLDDPAYVSTFLAPDMAWFEDYESLKETGEIPPKSSLLADVSKRLQWEILSEYSFQARIGRTLERTGCSVAGPDPERLADAVAKMIDALRNEIGGWERLEPEMVQRLVLGLLTRMRTKGAVRGIAPESYLTQWGNSFAFRLVPEWPNFGKHSRTPVFLTTKRGTRFDALLGTGKTPTWYQDWLARTLGSCNTNLGLYSDAAYEIVLSALTESGLIHRYDGLSHPVWALRPEAFLVEADVDRLRCNHCGAWASAPASQRASWEGMPCLRAGCPGNYTLQPETEDYYGHLYSTGEVHRIFAGEHTGLLKRAVREEIEQRFIEQRLPASENVLSCTPTLEMGIDIGDLSSVLLCSVPPAQASYLQRIGRSGRREGNAFNLAMAEGRPHDLYFFAEPTEMLAGRVDPPGVFLNAPAVLERQLVGYCFDRWVETGVRVQDLPRKISQVLANLSRRDREDRFPYNWLKFVDANRAQLLAGFQGMFGQILTESSKESLRRFMEGSEESDGSLSYKVLNRLHGLLSERESLRRRVRQITQALKAKTESVVKDQNTEREIAALEDEKASLFGIIQSITAKDTFNFLTDEGLLPNYTFPEAGVLLRSVIYRRKKATGKYDTRVYEYQRPAATAIHELAPSNVFYAEGRGVTIDRVNVELSEPEEWRLCDACNHAVREAQNEHKASCPRCGSPLWADDGQRRRMLRLRQVEAVTSDRASRVDDASETREPRFFCKHMLVDVEPASISRAFRIDCDEIPFGAEFLRRADFREVNFGGQSPSTETLAIAGYEVPTAGFKVCAACGRVASERHEFKHAATCRYRDGEAESPLLDALYLYREFSSEAVRMLLPASSSFPVRLHSFVAAIYLGLQKVYKGSIEHLQATLMEEPVPGSASRKQYLVIYDRVPGGTGYLKDLMQSDSRLFDVMSEALRALTLCECQKDPEKDGCYRCLYAYRNSRDMPEISRSEAIWTLSEILKHRDHLLPVETVGSISINTLLDSELESRFLEVLRRAKPDGQPVQLERDIVRGKPGWRLRIAGRPYAVVPQVDIGPSDGVAISSKPDFVFYPEKVEQGLPIAVFTDGFQYHADAKAGNLRVAEDLVQRMALARSGKFVTWSLTWQDVESRFRRTSGDYFADYTSENTRALGKLLDAYQDAHGTKVFSQTHRLDSFSAFVQFLSMENQALWGLYAFLLAINGEREGIGSADASWGAAAEAAMLEDVGWASFAIPPRPADPGAEHYARVSVFRDEVDRPLVALFAALPRAVAADPSRARELTLIARLFDDADIASDASEFRRCWNGFLRLYNYLQFLPRALFVTTQGLGAGLYAQLEDLQRASGAEQGAEVQQLLQLTDPAVHGLLRAVEAAGKVLPIAGYELTGDDGSVLATAELAWPDERLALLLEREGESGRAFVGRDWTIAPCGGNKEWMEEVVDRLPQRAAPATHDSAD